MADTLEDKDNGKIITPDQNGKFSKGRRRFLANTGMYTAGLMGSALLGACSDNDVFAQDDDVNPITDANILNFALNLEYLEAEFYLFAATGSGIPDNMKTGTGTQGTVSGGKMVDFDAGGDSNFSTLVREYANEIAADEYQHVVTLRNALGDAAVAEPQITLDRAFRAALGDDFDYAANPTNFLLAAFIFEDVGVTAYKGAAPLIQDPDKLSVAAGFLAAEAYHASLVRTVLYSQARFTGDQSLFDTVQTISDTRDDLADPTTESDEGISPRFIQLPDGSSRQGSNIVPLNTIGAAYGRTPGDVLNVVYLTPAEKAMGGFFPAGTNGRFKMSSAAPSSEMG